VSLDGGTTWQGNSNNSNDNIIDYISTVAGNESSIVDSVAAQNNAFIFTGITNGNTLFVQAIGSDEGIPTGRARIRDC
jgi:hypothetical protein